MRPCHGMGKKQIEKRMEEMVMDEKTEVNRIKIVYCNLPAFMPVQEFILL